LAKHTSTPHATSVWTRLSAPFMGEYFRNSALSKKFSARC
jgi:hypothetical protein